MRVKNQRGDDSVSIQVIETIADHRNRVPEELPVLYDTLDMDALETMYSGPLPYPRIEFEYAGYYVRIDSSGAVSVEPISG